MAWTALDRVHAAMLLQAAGRANALSFPPAGPIASRRRSSTAEAVVARAPKGAVLKARGMRGDWSRVEHAGVGGWVHHSLVE